MYGGKKVFMMTKEYTDLIKEKNQLMKDNKILIEQKNKIEYVEKEVIKNTTTTCVGKTKPYVKKVVAPVRDKIKPVHEIDPAVKAYIQSEIDKLGNQVEE
jgi:gas vesicle protein